MIIHFEGIRTTSTLCLEIRNLRSKTERVISANQSALFTLSEYIGHHNYYTFYLGPLKYNFEIAKIITLN